MFKPLYGGQKVVLALLAMMAAALSSFGQLGPVQGVGGVAPSRPPANSEGGFTLGVDESSPQIVGEDQTGETVVRAPSRYNPAFGGINIRAREFAQAGDSTTASVSSGLRLQPVFGLSDGLNRLQGQPFPNPTFWAGPVYIKFNDLTGALLVSDNDRFTEKNAQWGAIAILRLHIEAMVQLTPRWRLLVAGSVIYLPFRNEFGVEGFGVGDAIGLVAGDALAPITRMQLAYNTEWANWKVQFADDFAVRYVSIGADFNDNAFAGDQPPGVHAQDEAGRYVFGNGTTIPGQGVQERQNDFLDVRTFIALDNTVAGVASRLLPTETRMEFGASHTDTWFHDTWGTQGTNGFTFSDYSVDRVFAALRNERESMRFKPFAYYEAYRYNYNPDWTHLAAAGIAGPVTDYIHFYAEGGHYWSDGSAINTDFYRIRLTHSLSPYTTEMFRFSRIVTEPVAEIRDRYAYEVHQILGPDMRGRMLLERNVFTPLQRGVFGSVEDRAQIEVDWTPSGKFRARADLGYGQARFDNLNHDTETLRLARLRLDYRMSRLTSFSLVYRYLNSEVSSQAIGNHMTAENLWLLTCRRAL